MENKRTVMIYRETKNDEQPKYIIEYDPPFQNNIKSRYEHDSKEELENGIAFIIDEWLENNYKINASEELWSFVTSCINQLAQEKSK